MIGLELSHAEYGMPSGPGEEGLVRERMRCRLEREGVKLISGKGMA